MTIQEGVRGSCRFSLNPEFCSFKTELAPRGRARRRRIHITTGTAAYEAHRVPVAPEAVTGSISEIGYLRAPAGQWPVWAGAGVVWLANVKVAFR